MNFSDILDLVGGGVFGLMFLITAVKFVTSVRLVQQRRAEVVERLGRYHKTLNAGFHVLFPFLDKVAYKLDLREESIDVPPQECFTKDNVRVEVDGVIYLQVVNPERAAYGITNYRWAAMQLAQTTTRAVIGTLELDTTFEERDRINSKVVSELNEAARTWGLEVKRYEVKNIVPPLTVKDAMERQMAAERDRRAMLFRAEGAKEARINAADGKRQDLINRSEGEKQRRINEAHGRASEILAIAKATAESIEKVGYALAQPAGTDAVRLRLSEKYLASMRSLRGSTVVLPADLTQMDRLLEAVGLGAASAQWVVPPDEIERAKKKPPPAPVDMSKSLLPATASRVPPLEEQQAAATLETVLTPPAKE